MPFDLGTSSQLLTANSRMNPYPGTSTDRGVAMHTTRGRFEDRIGSHNFWISDVHGTTASTGGVLVERVAKKAIPATAASDTASPAARRISRRVHDAGVGPCSRTTSGSA